MGHQGAAAGTRGSLAAEGRDLQGREHGRHFGQAATLPSSLLPEVHLDGRAGNLWV